MPTPVLATLRVAAKVEPFVSCAEICGPSIISRPSTLALLPLRFRLPLVVMMTVQLAGSNWPLRPA